MLRLTMYFASIKFYTNMSEMLYFTFFWKNSNLGNQRPIFLRYPIEYVKQLVLFDKQSLANQYPQMESLNTLLCIRIFTMMNM